jgi:hypothetical protein
MERNASREPLPAKAKYVTLAVLLVWVAAVFAFTLWKFGGVVR